MAIKRGLLKSQTNNSKSDVKRGAYEDNRGKKNARQSRAII
jgi:hypothetical protein